MPVPRVMYLCGWPIGARGEGTASFVYEQIEALSSDVRALYVEHRFNSALGWARRRAVGADVERITDLWPKGVTALRVWTPRWSSRLTRRGILDDVWHAGPMVAARASRVLGGVDLVHAHVVLPAGLLGAAVAQTLGVPLVLQEHSGPFEMHLETDQQCRAVRRAFAQARTVIAVSDRLADRIRDFAGGTARLHIVPNLVRTDLFRAQPAAHDHSGIRLVCVSALHPIKGLDVLLRAVAELRARSVTVTVDIVGDGAIRAELVSMIDELGISDAVTLTGHLTRIAVAERMAEADICVCASRHETFGLAPAEALSVGRPVVSTQCGGPESFLTDAYGAVVPVDDERAMADAVVATWRRRAEFDPVAMHLYVDTRFGPTAFRDRVLRLYRDALGDRAAA